MNKISMVVSIWYRAFDTVPLKDIEKTMRDVVGSIVWDDVCNNVWDSVANTRVSLIKKIRTYNFKHD